MSVAVLQIGRHARQFRSQPFVFQLETVVRLAAGQIFLIDVLSGALPALLQFPMLGQKGGQIGAPFVVQPVGFQFVLEELLELLDADFTFDLCGVP